jgi:hypothetical protein
VAASLIWLPWFAVQSASPAAAASLAWVLFPLQALITGLAMRRLAQWPIGDARLTAAGR